MARSRPCRPSQPPTLACLAGGRRLAAVPVNVTSVRVKSWSRRGGSLDQSTSGSGEVGFLNEGVCAGDVAAPGTVGRVSDTALDGGCEPSGSVEGAFECDEPLPTARLRPLRFARPHPHLSSTIPTAARARIGHTRSRPSVLHCTASPSQFTMPMVPPLSLLFRRSSTIGCRRRPWLSYPRLSSQSPAQSPRVQPTERPSPLDLQHSSAASPQVQAAEASRPRDPAAGSVAAKYARLYAASACVAPRPAAECGRPAERAGLCAESACGAESACAVPNFPARRLPEVSAGPSERHTYFALLRLAQGEPEEAQLPHQGPPARGPLDERQPHSLSCPCLLYPPSLPSQPTQPSQRRQPPRIRRHRFQPAKKPLSSTAHTSTGRHTSGTPFVLQTTPTRLPGSPRSCTEPPPNIPLSRLVERKIQ